MTSREDEEKRGRVRRRITLADVARQVGVSTMTASRAISKPELVTPALRQQIERAMQDLGYVPNRAARALATSRSNVISVLIPSLSNAVFTDVLAGIQDAVDEEGVQVLIGNTRYSDKEERKLVGIHLQSNPDGVLLTGLGQSEEVRRMLAASGVPTVSMMDLSIGEGEYSVGLSQFDASYTMTRYLIDKGYRRIGFIAAQLDERTLKRAEGWRAALRAAGLYAPEREVLVPDPSTVALGAELLGRLLAVAPDCDAAFCCNDDLAYGAIYQCQRRGIAVPRQLAICGFNDLPQSAWMVPSLTTVGTPRYRIGFEAAILLKQLINGEKPARQHIDLGFTLMAREST
ncbi:HTH-type transcriptional regulator GntR [Noviherbaspirillum galbum]|uniref:LacI family DNA-binding transcriptional regulator n=1 Tax=Noviherbaspirillum galbum TaxID=2709383 RepID=A0A6B3SFH0_9BURK|nr:LacI family DNA-binding transcriptional regulator [Noviherbaspirillum galbum]NEX59571.1 LacI family DNA-binding transcriptional regulator [Noviherbaspirillum galbum]